jgi:hypothetical protein
MLIQLLLWLPLLLLFLLLLSSSPTLYTDDYTNATTSLSYMATNVVVVDCFYFSTVIIYHSGMSHIKDKIVDTAVCLRNKCSCNYSLVHK